MDYTRVNQAIEELTDMALENSDASDFSQARRFMSDESPIVMSDLRAESMHNASSPEREQLLINRIFDLAQEVENSPTWEPERPISSTEDTLWRLLQTFIVERAAESYLDEIQDGAS